MGDGKGEGEVPIEVTDWLPTRLSFCGKARTEGPTLYAKAE